MRLDTENEWTRSIARHIIAHAMEVGELTVSCDDDVDWSYDDWQIEHVSTRDEWIEVEATQDSYVSERRSRGSRMHPPEYETRDVQLHLHARAKWGKDDCPLAGQCQVRIEQEGGFGHPADNIDLAAYRYDL